MDCQQIKKYFPEYLEEEGLLDVRDQVQDHLASCPACRGELAAYQASWAALDEVEEIEPDGGYVSRFWTRLATEKPAPVCWWENIKETISRFKVVPVYATAVVMLLIAVMTFRYTTPGEGPATEIAQLNTEDVELLAELDMLENMELIEDLELLEDYEILEYMDSV